MRWAQAGFCCEFHCSSSLWPRFVQLGSSLKDPRADVTTTTTNLSWTSQCYSALDKFIRKRREMLACVAAQSYSPHVTRICAVSILLGVPNKVVVVNV